MWRADSVDRRDQRCTRPDVLPTFQTTMVGCQVEPFPDFNRSPPATVLQLSPPRTMPVRPSATHTKQAMAPVPPEDKCSGRKRRRPSASATTTSPMHPLEEEDIQDAALFDCDYADLDWDDSVQNQAHLKRLCIPAMVETFDDREEQQLSEEVRTLKASVHSMATTVAKAAQKINELRDLIALLAEQQRPEAGN